MNINAIRIFVNDLPEAKRFYEESLGLKLQSDGTAEGFCLFSAGSIDLIVEAVAATRPWTNEHSSAGFPACLLASPTSTVNEGAWGLLA